MSRKRVYVDELEKIEKELEKTLSWNSIKLLVSISSRECKELTKNEIQKILRTGDLETQGVIKELIKHGYFKSVQVRNSRGQITGSKLLVLKN